MGAKSAPKLLVFHNNLKFVYIANRLHSNLGELCTGKQEYLFYIIFYHSAETINVGNREIWEGGQGADGRGGKRDSPADTKNNWSPTDTHIFLA